MVNGEKVHTKFHSTMGWLFPNQAKPVNGYGRIKKTEQPKTKIDMNSGF